MEPDVIIEHSYRSPFVDEKGNESAWVEVSVIINPKGFARSPSIAEAAALAESAASSLLEPGETLWVPTAEQDRRAVDVSVERAVFTWVASKSRAEGGE